MTSNSCNELKEKKKSWKKAGKKDSPYEMPAQKSPPIPTEKSVKRVLPCKCEVGGDMKQTAGEALVLSVIQEKGKTRTKENKYEKGGPKSRIAFEAWKALGNIPRDSKVFVIQGTYPALREALLQRNWVENCGNEKMFFDFKWATKARVPVGIKDWQRINHFERNVQLSTKAFLTENLENLKGKDCARFYPKAFVTDKWLSTEFYEYFKTVYAVGLLKKYLESEKSVDIQKLHVSIKICKRVLNGHERNLSFFVNSLQWNVLAANNHRETTRHYKKLLSSKSCCAASLRAVICGILQEFKRKDPQFRINGNSNLWIVKPGRKSRGRDIGIYSNLTDIRRHISSSTNWVIQKYIERPLLINNRKFDIRQWVLITSSDPLTVYIYLDSYLRFSVEDFSLTDTNLFIHLTNNSIAKHSSNFTASEIDGCMWHIDQFKSYLTQTHGYDAWDDSIFRRIKKIVKYSLRSVGRLGLRKANTFELFGYDFMVDENLRPWLLEVNSSPSMDYSTRVTAHLVKQVLHDVIKIVIDHKDGKVEDSGRFALLFKAKAKNMYV